ncbi:uncharacterized protein [Branchiostoma lanceolatum]|uniref:uncharacterized protein n=1 Tax=Branchiostoma lanceolatum TaxID=7740 RepID=UPI003455EDA7
MRYAGNMKRSRHGVFTQYTAWFSRSVPEETVRAWLQQEGALADQSCAKFLFSVEADCPDTIEFFQSSLYLDERLSMFHADFVDASVQHGGMSVVPIGMYVLPPTELHPELERRGKLAWMKTTGSRRKDTEDIIEDSVTEGRHTVGERGDLASLADSERPLAADSSEHVAAITSSSTVMQATNSQNHREREDILQPSDCLDVITSNEKVTEEETETQLTQRNRNRPASPCCSTAPEPSTEAHPDPCDSCRAPHQFLHSRLDDIPHVADLQMGRRGVLQDFVPGSNGFSVKCCSK